MNEQDKLVGARELGCPHCAAHYGDTLPCDEGKPVNSPHRRGAPLPTATKPKGARELMREALEALVLEHRLVLGWGRTVCRCALCEPARAALAADAREREQAEKLGRPLREGVSRG